MSTDIKRKPGIPLPISIGRGSSKNPTRRTTRNKETSPSERIDQLAQESADSYSPVDLLLVARGVAMILDGLHDQFSQKSDFSSVTSGLAYALFFAADQVDLRVCQSAGELVRTLAPEVKAALLRRELKRLADRKRKRRAQ